MLSPLRIVSPFKPFEATSEEHKNLGPFDWIAALTMLEDSVRRNCPETDFRVITDEVTQLPLPTLHIPTKETQLMLWILEVGLRYMESDHFDRDTVMVSPDSLVFRDLRPWFAGDIGIVMRWHDVRPILNSLQWWPVRSRDACIRIYKRALRRARELSEELQIWGADTEPFREMFQPIIGGISKRRGFYVNFIHEREVMEPLTRSGIDTLEAGEPIVVKRAVVDFRYLRKQHMKAFYDATIGKDVPV